MDAREIGEAIGVSDRLTGRLHDLEQFQWFVRAHLKESTGEVVHRTTYDKS